MKDKARIIFSRHADDMIVERQIQRDWVYDTLADPELVEVDPDRLDVKRAFRRIPAHGKRFLRVVYVEFEGDIKVVTVFFDRAKSR